MAWALQLSTAVNNKWLSIATGVVMMLAGGTQYLFAVYAPELKTRLSYTQTEVCHEQFTVSK